MTVVPPQKTVVLHIRQIHNSASEEVKDSLTEIQHIVHNLLDFGNTNDFVLSFLVSVNGSDCVLVYEGPPNCVRTIDRLDFDDHNDSFAPFSGR